MKAIYVARHQPTRPTPGLAERRVTESMTSPVLCVRLDTSLGDALQTMVRAGRRHLVVVDEAGRCVGILADRALAAAWARDPAAFASHAVAATLDARPATVELGARIVDVARIMQSAGDDAVAVLDPEGRPAGIVTGSDLVALLAGHRVTPVRA